MKKSGIPISISMCIGPLGDFNDVPVEEVGVRLAKAGEIKLDIYLIGQKQCIFLEVTKI